LLDDIRRLVRFLRTASRASEQKLGISSAQLFVLHELLHRPAQSLNELAERTFTHQSSVSVVVKRLAARGLLAREPVRSDARRLRIAIAQKGHDLLRRAPEVAQLRLIDALSSLEPDSLRELGDGLAALTRELGIDGEVVRLFFEEEEERAHSKPRVRPKRTKRVRTKRTRRGQGTSHAAS
jgi:DNA-binding MarR family transcriptional regulator